MSKPHYIYVAGPISQGDTLLNIKNGIDMGVELVKKGFTPYVPHQDFVAYMMHPDVLDYETILAQDFDWIERCDALIRLPGPSKGADREIAHCRKVGVPVFYSLSALEAACGRKAS